MQKTRQKRYWAGKAPDWAEEGGEVADAAPAAAAAPPAAPLPGPPPPLPATAVTADPRLLRLTQRLGTAGRRDAAEAVVVQRRHARTPESEEDAEPRRQQAEQAREPGGDVGEADGEEEDEEAIAARRMAIRARQLAAAAAAAGPASDEEEGSEYDSSEYTTDDSDDEGGGGVLLKPAFVPKTERETLAEREAVLAQAEQTTRQEAEQLEERKRQTQALVQQAAQQEAQQEAPAQDGSDLDTDDDKDEVAQYEAWRERELQRIARDRQLRQAGTKAEAAAMAQASGLPAAPAGQHQKKWKFLQKYWHKGAFFQTEDEEGEDVLGDVMRRDYDAPTGEDKFDKQMLPKIMQVRNFGRRGRTKWSHLLAEDTTMQASGMLDPAASRPRTQQVQDFSKPRMSKT